MSNYWKDLLPVDPYVVKSSGLLQDLDRQIVTLLYQPLIGSFRSACFSRCGESWSKTESGEKLDSQTADGGDADQPEDDSLRKGKA